MIKGGSRDFLSLSKIGKTNYFFSFSVQKTCKRL